MSSPMARNTTRLQYEQKMGNLLSKYWGALQIISNRKDIRCGGYI